MVKQIHHPNLPVIQDAAVPPGEILERDKVHRLRLRALSGRVSPAEVQEAIPELAEQATQLYQNLYWGNKLTSHRAGQDPLLDKVVASAGKSGEADPGWVLSAALLTSDPADAMKRGLDVAGPNYTVGPRGGPDYRGWFEDQARLKWSEIRGGREYTPADFEENLGDLLNRSRGRPGSRGGRRTDRSGEEPGPYTEQARTKIDRSQDGHGLK
ncbi:MAG: hypothetical protein GF416_04030 [Candidatus Altiarchaeales archaeon]|nr:hypothetical protein [Candidatus Altiarchaeales archaeon]MBD3416288.1 hypothetical protein [Candidatus Altiarchaeales archaeon]